MPYANSTTTATTTTTTTTNATTDTNLSFGPKLHTPGFLATRLLECLPDKRTSAQRRLGNAQLVEARSLAKRHKALIGHSDMDVFKDKVRQCVVSSQSISESCLTPIRAEEIKAGLKSKNIFSRFLKTRDYRKSAEEALRFVKVSLTHHT